MQCARLATLSLLIMFHAQSAESSTALSVTRPTNVEHALLPTLPFQVIASSAPSKIASLAVPTTSAIPVLRTITLTPLTVALVCFVVSKSAKSVKPLSYVRLAMKVSFPAALDHVWSATSKTALLASPITSVNSAETIIFLQWTRPSATIAIFLDAWPAPLTSSVAPVSQDSPLISMSTVYFPAATNVKWPTARVVTNKTNALTVPLATS